MSKTLLQQAVDILPQVAKEELDSLTIRKTKKGNQYVHNGIKELDDTNKKIADKGGSIFDQYAYEDNCMHGFDYDSCPICD